VVYETPLTALVKQDAMSGEVFKRNHRWQYRSAATRHCDDTFLQELQKKKLSILVISQ